MQLNAQTGFEKDRSSWAHFFNSMTTDAGGKTYFWYRLHADAVGKMLDDYAVQNSNKLSKFNLLGKWLEVVGTLAWQDGWVHNRLPNYLAREWQELPAGIRKVVEQHDGRPSMGQNGATNQF